MTTTRARSSGSIDWNSVRSNYKNQVNLIEVPQSEKNEAKRKINNLFNVNTMKIIVKNLKKKSRNDVLSVNVARQFTSVARDIPNPMKFVKFSNNFIGSQIWKDLWRNEKLLIGSGIGALITGLGIVTDIPKFMTRIGNYKQPSVLLNNKSYAAVKRYEQLFDKGEFSRGICMYLFIIAITRAFLFFCENKTKMGELYLKKIMDSKIGQYSVGGVTIEMLRRTAFKFVIASYTAFIHGSAFMAKEKAALMKPGNRVSTLITSKFLDLSYTFWAAPEISNRLPNQNSPLLKKGFYMFIQALLTLGGSGLVGRGPVGVAQNISQAVSSRRSSVLQNSPASVRQPRKRSNNQKSLTLYNSNKKEYVFTDAAVIKHIMNHESANGASGRSETILKNKNGKMYRVNTNLLQSSGNFFSE